VNGPLREDEGGEAPCFAHLIEDGLLDVVTDRLALDASDDGAPQQGAPAPEPEEAGDRAS
jgi:hypothetical protein